MFKRPSKTILEYIWIGGKDEIRSKTKVIHKFLPDSFTLIPKWNYDGSSTWQADSNGDTEITLKPCAVYKDPTRKIDDTVCYLVLCDTYNSEGKPISSNNRYIANNIFNEREDLEPWFGLEQEYFITFPLENNKRCIQDGLHYCGLSESDIERNIAEKHLQLCIEAGINISGLNAEVCRCQWEFQVGPSKGISAGDDLIVARYLLGIVAEKFNAKINYHPKPDKNQNGSGCHINFSTNKTRYENGIEEINKYINKLQNKHSDHIKVYGEFNDLRLTGLHETSSYSIFTYGVGTRNTSVRIPNNVVKDGYGYFEDRRPASNVDPYLATSIIFKTCCLEEN
jgi:glutamine synthetase